MAYYMNRQAPMSGIAGLLALRGRMGDTELVHMSKPEINMLRSMGELTINPRTGLPEAFSLEDAMTGISGLMSQDMDGREAMQQLMNFGRNKIAEYNEPAVNRNISPIQENQGLSGIMTIPTPPMPVQQPSMEENFSEQGGLAALKAGQRPSDTKSTFEGMVDVNNNNGDGMSDDVPFKVTNDPKIKNALLSRDEYVVAADVVSSLGNGSSDAGAEILDEFMEDVRIKAKGSPKQQKQIDGRKIMRELV